MKFYSAEELEGKTETVDELMKKTTILHRNNMYNIFWKFYRGRHWKFEREQVPQLTFNYCKAFVNKSVAFLIGNGFKINSEDLKAEKLLNDVWKKTGKDMFLLELVQAGSVMGDVWVKVGYDDDKEQIDLSLVNPIKVYPVFEELRNNILKEVIIVNSYIKDKKKFNLVEHITKDKLWEVLNGKVINERENTLGEIPLVHIKNMPIPFQFYGESDLDSLISLNKEYNEKATDFSETIDYQGSPVVVVKGAKAKNLERGSNKVWGGLPKDASVSLLEMAGGLEEARKYLLSLKQAMHEMASVPEEALGKTQPISNTSGIALEVRYRPLIEKTKVKRRTYGYGIEQINELILKTLQVKENFNAITNENEVIFASPFPKDKTIELQNFESELRMGVESRMNVAKQLGKDNIEDLMQEIQQDREEDEAVPFLSNQREVDGSED